MPPDWLVEYAAAQENILWGNHSLLNTCSQERVTQALQTPTCLAVGTACWDPALLHAQLYCPTASGSPVPPVHQFPVHCEAQSCCGLHRNMLMLNSSPQGTTTTSLYSAWFHDMCRKLITSWLVTLCQIQINWPKVSSVVRRTERVRAWNALPSLSCAKHSSTVNIYLNDFYFSNLGTIPS